MDNHPLDKQSRSRSFRATFSHLFFREKDPFYVYLILVLITLFGLILRILLINKPIAYDEAYTFIHFASRPFRHILADYSAPNNHIFHTILVGFTYRLFGGQPWALRLPAFIAGTLLVPVMYVTARRFFSFHQALAASMLTAIAHWFIVYSVNGRGYTMLILFALLLANFAGILVIRQSRPALIAFALAGALGFYTIPIFLYPMAGISLWVVMTYLIAKEPRENKSRQIAVFLGICILSGLLTLILYSPVIIFGTGFSSITSNEIVESLGWSAFTENLYPRINGTWQIWMTRISPAAQYLFAGGFLLSLLFYRRVSNQKLPLQVFLALSIAVLLLVQRVTPIPRTWLYLEAFYLLFAAAGLVWLAELLVRKIAGPLLTRRILSLAILLTSIGVFANTLIRGVQDLAVMDRGLLPEAYAAGYLVEHLRPEDTIIATGPVDIQTAYYLSLNDIPFDRFYKRDQPAMIQNALVVLRKNSKYNTPESILNFFKLDDDLDLTSAEQVFEYANVQIYSIPAK